MAQQETTFGGVDIPRFLAGVPMIAVNRPVEADGEPRTLPPLGPTLFRHPLKPAERGLPFRGSGKPLVWLPGPPVWNCLLSA
ncbi:hypothetical protein EJ069_21595 [Mesorhizobium sp. M2A.F.Ca.ET.043.05.1.1]|uniref:hypothetical protein n=1 Tax=Mesorhizobium sp. M2A.F.Ca.ET.043.05.1.1 TaxID=2493671 RepID=UPI000F75C3A7|nr:hypothetical protein [Mesorhizobium sp. M2A.F.Ca.ET.043.05.1.1]AZO17072.1 hypothetical protein EJ069_21595 [Mesorhizobium sp. M2A.F.Ca.ET.043.05.1.1]